MHPGAKTPQPRSYNEPANEIHQVWRLQFWSNCMGISYIVCTLERAESNASRVGVVGFQNSRLDIPKEVDPRVASIIYSCWDNDPIKQPSFFPALVAAKEITSLVPETTSG